MPARRNQRRVDSLLIVRAARDPGPEGEIARNMLETRRAAREAARATQALPERLSDISDDIKAEWGKGVESQFAIGHLLMEARALFPGDTQFGRWIKAQNFPFGAQTSKELLMATKREDEVRAFLASRLNDGRSALSINTAIQRMNAKPKPERERLAPVDPAYAALRDARNRILGSEDEPANAFVQMHVDDLAASAKIIMALATAYQEAKSSRE